MRIAQNTGETKPGLAAALGFLVAILAPFLVKIGLPEPTPDDVETFVTLATAAVSAVSAAVVWIGGFLKRGKTPPVGTLAVLFLVGAAWSPATAVAANAQTLPAWAPDPGPVPPQGFNVPDDFVSLSGRCAFRTGTGGTIFLPDPRTSRLDAGDIVTAEGPGGCYGARLQTEERNALAVWSTDPFDLDGPGADWFDPVTVNVYRDGGLAFSIPTGFFYEPDGILGDLTPVDSLDQMIADLNAFLATAEAERAGLIQDLEAAELARDQARSQASQALAERDAAVQARQTAEAQRDQALVDLAEAEADRDQATGALSRVLAFFRRLFGG